MNYSKISAFLAITFGLIWISVFAADLFNVGVLGLLALSVVLSWAPGISAIVVQKWLYQEPLSKLGLSRKHFGAKWILTSIFGPYAILVSVIALVFLLGNLLHLPGFGFVVFGEGDPAFPTELSHYLSNLMGWNPGAMMPPEFWILVVFVLAAGFFFGPTFGLVTSLGEELGWRGLMLEETKKLGFLGSNLIIGGLWGLLYAPQILYFSEPEMGMGEIFLSVLTFTGYAICFSFPLAYLSRKSQTIFGPAIFRGVFNIINTASFFFIWGENPLVGSATGLAGMLIFLTITWFIIRRDPGFVENYSALSYESAEAKA